MPLKLISRWLYRIYGRPIRKGAMMSWDEAKRAYLIAVATSILVAVFFIGFLYKGLALTDTIHLVLVGFLGFCCTAIIATIWGYHHRDEVIVGDEVPMDSNGVYWGAAAGALAPVIYRWIESFFRWVIE